jgi:hypothetical protein
MKLPKALLSAILIGIAVQTTSCTKDKELPDQKKETKAEKEKSNTPQPCPACGMG